jgi:hypothetical protein
MEVCYSAHLFMPLVILHHLLNVFVQLAKKRGFKKKGLIWQWLTAEQVTEHTEISYSIFDMKLGC